MKRTNVVYLSSSAHSDWRSTVKTQYQHSADVILVGPCEEHGLSDSMGAPGDLRPGHKLRITQMLSKSHILFGISPVINIDHSTLCWKLVWPMPGERK